MTSPDFYAALVTLLFICGGIYSILAMVGIARDAMRHKPPRVPEQRDNRGK